VIEAINKIGSVFYGPILGIFLLAVLTKSTHARAANIGLVVGVLFNVYLWKAQPQIFWFWWNCIGLIVTVSIGYFGSMVIAPSSSEVQNTLDLEKPDFRMPETWVLLSYFAAIVLFSCALPYLLG
jgi:Na+/proline symporter